MTTVVEGKYEDQGTSHLTVSHSQISVLNM